MFFVFEFTDHGPSEHVTKHVGEMYDTMHGLANPVNYGRPTSRTRLYMFGWLKSKWTSSASFEEFEDIYKERCQLTFDDYLLESDDVRNAEMHTIAAKRGHCFPEGTVVTLENALTPHQLQRKLQHESLWDQESAYGTDLDHSVGYATAGRHVPCLESTGTIASISQQKLMTPKQHLVVPGEPIFSEVHACSGPCLFQGVLDGKPPTVSGAELKRLAGQSMHMHILAPFLLYNLSLLRPKP